MDARPVNGGITAEASSGTWLFSPLKTHTAPNTMSSTAGNSVPMMPPHEPSLAKRSPPRSVTSVAPQ